MVNDIPAYLLMNVLQVYLPNIKRNLEAEGTWDEFKAGLGDFSETFYEGMTEEEIEQASRNILAICSRYSYLRDLLLQANNMRVEARPRTEEELARLVARYKALTRDPETLFGKD
jgi:hypothetical protein